jgi:tetratricopeptide (TPR) repeat protein
MRKVLWALFLAIAGGVAGVYLLALFDPDLANPAQAALIGWQSIQVEFPFLRPSPPPPDHIRILIVHLEGDPDEVATIRLCNVLQREPIFETILIHRPIHLSNKGTYTEARQESDGIANELARKWNADAVIYGSRDMNAGMLDLSVIPANAKRGSALTPYFFDQNSFQLPDRLSGVLGAVTVAGVLSRRGMISNPRTMIATAARLENMLNHSGGTIGQALRSGILATLADLELTISGRTKDLEWADKALVAYNSSQAWAVKHEPWRWFATEVNSGVALQTIGAAHKDVARLKESIEAFRTALRSLRNIDDKRDRARVEFGLAISLTRVGEINSDPSFLEDAAAMLDDAISIETNYLARASMWTILGESLIELNDLKPNLNTLKRAAQAFRQAAGLYASRNSNSEWSNAEEGIGDSIAKIYEKTNDSSQLPEAITSYRNALTVPDHRTELEMANLRYNLAVALSQLGSGRGDEGMIKSSLASYAAARSAYLRLGRDAEAQEAQSGMADDEDCLRKIAAWHFGMAKKMPSCRLWTEPQKLRVNGDVRLHWDSSNATGGEITPTVGKLQNADGWIEIYGISATTVFVATFANSANQNTVTCSTTVRIVT